MTYSTQFHIPGSFVDHPVAVSGAYPDVFRPPTSPSASSSAFLAKSATVGLTGADSLVANHAAKRKRGPERDTRENTPARDWNGATSTWDGDASRRYMLAGQLDTPGSGRPSAVVEAGGINVGRGGVDEGAAMEESVYSDVGYRRALAPDYDTMMDSPSGLFGPIAMPQPPTPSSAGWSRFALGAIGGVVGKVWEFCKAGAFKGFIAGGGKGVPAFATTPDSTPSRPAAKRRQVREVRNEDDLGRNWVIVGDPTGERRRRTTTGGVWEWDCRRCPFLPLPAFLSQHVSFGNYRTENQRPGPPPQHRNHHSCLFPATFAPRLARGLSLVLQQGASQLRESSPGIAAISLSSTTTILIILYASFPFEDPRALGKAIFIPTRPGPSTDE
ncbi:unnamed protein product [Parascedosporium putredinis]|uniref:Uncharacterized protein n=1 Tax=Parascedosporium putredinis TaxID=1442378 RepID=A0A9P1H2Q6_9PEZI|nr:unnamed protein product [Parascedosporium putredinis]CAI7995193.1 unnamed protein product [Parascedosporium putredinis]